MLRISPHVVLTKDEHENPNQNQNQDADDMAGAVLLNKKSGTYFRLNPMAVTVFELLRAGQSPEAIVSALQARHPGAADRIPDDVQKVIATMRNSGVLI
ncbi:Coenzyme PQQ synthesis protein D (PqqD) [Streptomyces sp. yr375]|uniref:PqqD family peptide modification chaperone n=1 Tax=Streptomyces sp. yr375 TaxID=1761906 RepID=UPI0008AD226E|nr:PqqD family peptide modification chaperone [Streptomyces sp. yr375]SER60972.1 Coenzyme PQQ synthesis protein D (PqqD) [Streptomyces sp. yr375]